MFLWANLTKFIAGSGADAVAAAADDCNWRL